MYLSAECLASCSTDQITTADLVVEVVSPGRAVYDRNTKAQTYEALGVVELWLIDPQARCMDSIHWGGTELRQHLEASDALGSDLSPGFRPLLESLLPRGWPPERIGAEIRSRGDPFPPGFVQ